SSVIFSGHSTGGNAQLAMDSSRSSVDSSSSSGPNGDGKLSVGSIEGVGTFFLGNDQLTVGGNNLSTTVGGVIADGGTNSGTGGALVKVGSGTLTLTGQNTYSGGTTIAAGRLQIDNIGALGSGPISFNGALRSTVSGTLTNDISVASGAFETISVAPGQTLTL